VSAYYYYIRVLTCVLTLLYMRPGITQAQVDAAPEFLIYVSAYYYYIRVICVQA
jgi:hypothetical protein